MDDNKIEADVIYDHEKYGEVLVTGIGKMYDEWDITGPQEDIESVEVLVFFHDRFDGYGGMQPTPTTENVNEFAKKASRKRMFEYDAISKLREDD